MPNKKFHVAAGGVAGSAAAGFGVYLQHARETQVPPDTIHDMAQLAGGVFWGAVGARLPDVIEPATSPNHRSHFHSLPALAASAAATAGFEEFEDWSRDIARDIADERRRQWRAALETEDPLEGIVRGGLGALALLGEIGWCVIASAPRGISAGYASHLIADGTTPRGLPPY